ncbi:MAG: primosomal protein [bacterium]|nr:primosomal protein [bacterium]
MDIDPRAALDRFIEALTTHYEAVVSTQDPESPAVLRASEVLEESFVAYDDSLFTHYDADLPFDVYDDDDEDEVDDDLEDLDDDDSDDDD